MIFGNPVKQATIRPAGAPPVAGSFRVTQPFGCTGVQAEPAYGGCRHFHRGLDLGNLRCGDTVVAAAAGTVRNSAVSGAGEHYIAINHGGGWVTMYGHLSSRAVVKGEEVKEGQKLGVMGSTGNSIGCHLHFGVKSQVGPAENVYLDSVGKMHNPWPLLKQNLRARLKGDGIRVRATAGTDGKPGAIFAVTKDGRIIRKADREDLGSTAEWRDYGGVETGASWSVGELTGTAWALIRIDGAYRYAAKALVELSAS
jgi:murein DD-endopeptidase MepM/ murein hydrolase activator NlpD